MLSSCREGGYNLTYHVLRRINSYEIEATTGEAA